MRVVLLLLVLVLAPAAFAQGYQPAYETHGGALGRGPELVLVYFGMTECVPCHDPDFKADLERAKGLLAEQAAATGRGFAAVGVAMDWDVAEGFAFVQGSGRFDEVAIGRNWENAAALTHLWRPDGLESRQIAIPSVLVYEREVTSAASIAATAPIYRFEAAGADAIRAWVAAGAPVE